MESASLPVATFAKFQPHSIDFLDLVNPKAVLESRLRYFACLSKGDVIAIIYNDKTYEMSVLETKPGDVRYFLTIFMTFGGTISRLVIRLSLSCIFRLSASLNVI